MAESHVSLSFAAHPIALAELHYQRHAIATSRAGRLWIVIALVLLVPASLYALASFIAALLGMEAVRTLHRLLTETVSALLLADLFTMNVALYAVVTMVTFALASNSITREQRGKTWDSLLLTNVNARQVVLGKWWATLRVLWDDHALIALLRLGLVGWLSTPLFQQLSLSIGVTLDVSGTSASAFTILLAGALVIAGTFLDAAFTAALGVLAPLLRLPGPLTTTLMITTRLIMGLAVLAWVIMTAYFVGGGSMPFAGAAAPLVLYAMLILGILYLAQMVAVRQQAVSPSQDKSH